MILSTAYFPPVEYFVILARCSSVFIETEENYQKQTYRNRCRILTSNGPMDLRFPIIHDGSRKIRDIRVDYSTPWVRQTEYAITTAYSSSPFFEYYRDGLFAILNSHPETLWELNMRITEFFCSKIGIPSPYEPREGSGKTRPCGPPHSVGPLPFREPMPPGVSSRDLPDTPPAFDLSSDNLKDEIAPKKKPVLRNAEYWQVFKEKFGFVPNLSIMDLLFNEGPESLSYLIL